MRRQVFLSLFAVGALLTLPVVARADVKHTIAKGHTIQAIAARYHVTEKSIIDANHLKDVKHLKVGDVLTIPGVDPPSHESPSPSKAKAAAEKKSKLDEKADKEEKKHDKKSEQPTSFAAKAKTPGVVHLHRIATTEEQDIRVTDKHGKVSEPALKSFEKLLRSQGGLSHPIDARLVSLLGVVSNHFGSRKIEVVSGFRPYTPTQYTPHSNHNHGRAVDFRVVGVPNEAVRDFCRSLKNTGCGYYPNSTFVHMDVRDSSAFWIDYSKPGEPPHYNAPNVDADEGTSDVHNEGHLSTGATPPTTPDGEPSPSENTPPPQDAPKPVEMPSPAPPSDPAKND